MKEKLKEFAAKAWGNFKDDPLENCTWAACGFGIGYLVRWIFG